jgi:hypothetical protein
MLARRLSAPPRRWFSVILSTGEKVEREMSTVEREIVNLKEYEFSKLGLFKKKQTNEKTLYKLFQMAQPKSKSDYAACVYAVNHFYNFGVSMDHHELANRWLATAVETGRIDEAVELVKLWQTFLPTPPKIEVINVLIGMVKIQQSRDILKAIRENWQIPLSSYAYTTVIAKELGRRFVDPDSVREAFVVWQDACKMDVVLPIELNECLLEELKNSPDEAECVRKVMQEQTSSRIAVDRQ